MADGTIQVTVSGNLTSDPELSYTPSGHAICKFTVAVGSRRYDRNAKEWKDAGTSFVRCVAWRQLGENVVESLARGNRVVVTGTFASREYTDRKEVKRVSWELTVDDVGSSLVYGTSTFKKATRTTAEEVTGDRDE